MIECWSRGDAGEYMPDEILVDLSEAVHRHPWWRARASLTIALLAELGVSPPSTVLDAGCGWGVTLEALEARGFHVAGMDVSRLSLDRLDRPGRRLIEADLTRPLDDRAPEFDAVLALDVIEHLDDDAGAVRRLGRLAKPGGWVVVSVPALPEMYGEFDRIQGHRRRYVPETIRAAFDGSGLEVERVFWWGRWMLPALGRQRARIRMKPGESAAEGYRRYLDLPPWPVGVLARLAFAIEEKRAIRGRLEVGTSLFAAARRPRQPAPRSLSLSQIKRPATVTA